MSTNQPNTPAKDLIQNDSAGEPTTGNAPETRGQPKTLLSEKLSRFLSVSLIVLAIVAFATLVIRWQLHLDYKQALDAEKVDCLSAKTALAATLIQQAKFQVESEAHQLAAHIERSRLSWKTPSDISTLNSRIKSLLTATFNITPSRAQMRTIVSACHTGAIKPHEPWKEFIEKFGLSPTISNMDTSPAPAITPELITQKVNEYTFQFSIYGSAVAVQPSAAPTKKGDYWWTYLSQRNLHATHEGFYGNEDWFTRPLQLSDRMKGVWVKPYLDSEAAGDTYMTTYSVPFALSPGGTPVGVVTADITINFLEDIARRLVNGDDGFSAITQYDGTYLYHPMHNYVKEKKTLLDIAEKKKDENRRRVYKLGKAGKAAVIHHKSTTTGEYSWLIVEPIAGDLKDKSHWSLQNTFFKESYYSKDETSSLRRDKIFLAALSVITTTLFIIMIVNIIGWTQCRAWCLVITVSILLSFAIGHTWDLALNETKPKNSSDTVVTTTKQIHEKVEKHLQAISKTDSAVLNEQNKPLAQTATEEDVSNNVNLDNSHQTIDQKEAVNAHAPEKAPLKRTHLVLPTGLYLESIDLATSNEVSISGRAWVRLMRGAEQALRHNKNPITFGSAKSVSFSSLPDTQNEAGETIKHWEFKALLTTDFDHTRYPLEKEYLDILILSTPNEVPLYLVPDVESYHFNANRHSGLRKDLFIPGWTVYRTYFTLTETEPLKPTFGKKRDFDNREFYNLHFKIGIKRVFVDAFISNLTPLIVVAIILFAVSLLPISKDFDISRILGICVSVFFVIVFAHLAIRSNIATGKIFYLEYFFFTIYAALILVPIDAFRVKLGIKSAIFEYENGLFYKVLFWPSLLFVFYLVTINKFY